MTTYAPRLRFGSVDKYLQPRSNGLPLAPKTVADTRSTIRQMFSSTVDLEVMRRDPARRPG